VRKVSKVYKFDLRYIISIGYSNGANIASSFLLIHPEIITSEALFRAMVLFIPEKVPNLTGKNIFFIGAGQYDPIVPRKQTETLFWFF
jgi:phospholipase/carboxylesterase